MQWTDESAARFFDLRQRELLGTLGTEEQTELAALIADLEAQEAQQLARTIEHMHSEQNAIRLKLQKLQIENEDLSKVLNQQD